MLVVNTSKQTFTYATEAEILNVAVFGKTSSARANENPKKSQN